MISASYRKLLVLLLLASPACGDEGGDSDNAEATTQPLPKIEINPDDWEVYRFSDLKLPYKTSAACIDFGKTKRNDTSAFTTCMCNHCLERMQECDVLKGCREIVDCSTDSGCKNEYTCYLIPGAPCTETVDLWGNASVATTVSLEIMDCSTANHCR
jgi:hypothetical protein